MSVVLRDWLGEGGTPVSKTLAEQRTDACLHGYHGDKCPSNVEPNWWGRVKSVVADAVKEHIAHKNNMGLVVDGEEELGICKECSCCLPTKIWVPIKHIAVHSTKAQVDALPSHCWQKKEILNLKES